MVETVESKKDNLNELENTEELSFIEEDKEVGLL